jgi:DNA replication protein DnaC
MVVQIKSRINTTTLLKDCIENKNNEELIKFLTDYRDNLENKINNYENLVLTGNCGVGKTFIINAFINEINKIVLEKEVETYDNITYSMIKSIKRTKCNATIINVYNIIKYLRDLEYNNNKNEYSINFKKDFDILVIDEIGVQFSTDAERQILYDVFDYRYNNFKPTFLISNLPINNSANSLEKVLGLRIYDRVVNSQTKIINLCGNSFR